MRANPLHQGFASASCETCDRYQSCKVRQHIDSGHRNLWQLRQQSLPEAVLRLHLVDIQAATVTVYREPEGNGYRVTNVYQAGDSIVLRAFGDETVAVAEMGL